MPVSNKTIGRMPRNVKWNLDVLMLSASLQLMTFQPTDLHQKEGTSMNTQKIVSSILIAQDSMKQNLLQNLEFSLLILQSVCIEKYFIQMFEQSSSADGQVLSNHGP